MVIDFYSNCVINILLTVFLCQIIIIYLHCHYKTYQYYLHCTNILNKMCYIIMQILLF